MSSIPENPESTPGGVVVATRALPEPSLSTLEPDFDVRILDYRPDEEQLVREVAEADALITLVTDPVTEAVLSAGKKLKIVGQYGVGVDNIDRAAAAARGIVVTNTPNALTDATADLTLGLLLALARRIVEGDRLVRSGQVSGWGPSLLLRSDLKGEGFRGLGPGAKRRGGPPAGAGLRQDGDRGRPHATGRG